MKEKRRQNGFSIDMVSKNYIDVLSISEKGEKVLIEGRLGELKETDFLDNSVLVTSYSNGVLRLDIDIHDIIALTKSKKEG
ncbi:MAG: hypothetical protein NWF07_06035 [Candidatus Bathyarchaeota archaeon]|nr:hypothetical protein [Candidatus Bathyarchaeota archaeon]